MVYHIKIRRAGGTWVVRAGGAVLAESHDALELIEGEMKPVIYFPREDIAMAFLERSEQTTHSRHMGDANYYAISTKSDMLSNAAWSYENPAEGIERIKDHIAFYTNNGQITLEQL
ncbi:DUF427 domain-containing protein [Tropicimonas sp. IMCC34043]|uniref:DUF427 domain-containing protein n=1 Tax=Tropicimonas sp. IMCC34043 TaxID=2248760 RepID=UPI000E272E66|nr:DUF427 domain-containing protein [Tropicimonas sp. IMCC34043]